MSGSYTLTFPEPPEADLPFLSVFKDGALVECMCLHGLDSIVLGRHTNCDLMVTHPSVSRHHLEIQVLHSSRELLLTDLDSIHGTWINGEQALPLVPVTAKEGDSFKLGASSRLYSVQWRPRPPQNSTSSEEYSHDSNLPLYCTKSADQGPTGSMTTMESRKPCQVDAGKTLQPQALSSKCDNDHAYQDHKVEQESEITSDSLNKGKGASILNNENLSEVLQEGKTAAEFQPEDGIQEQESVITINSLNKDNSKDGKVAEVLQSRTETDFLLEDGIQEGESDITAKSLIKDKAACFLNDEKLAVVLCKETTAEFLPDGRIELMSRDSNMDSKESKDRAICETACISTNSLQIDLPSSMKKDDFVKQAGRQQEQDSRNKHGVLEVCEHRGNSEFQAEKPSEEANSALSKLWLRRSGLNPPPNLLTSTNSACSTIPLPLQEKKKNSSLPSAPPMPLSYLINDWVPSINPLLSPGKNMKVDKGRADDAECISDEFASEDAKENNYCAMLSHHERSGNIVHHNQLMKHVEGIDDYISDKENDSPGLGLDCKQLKPLKSRACDEGTSRERSHFSTTEGSRKPFQPLALSADGDGYKPWSSAYPKDFTLDNNIHQIEKGQSPVIQNLDLMLRKLKGLARSEPRRLWHIVVDVSCFRDSNSFKSLRQLEGIREVRLIIPKIVISELDSRRGMGRSQRKALGWIESCMVKLPSWIHVQSSSENLPVAATPPISPVSAQSIYSGSYESMVSPTNGDNVLNCALLFNSTVFSGQVALLTNEIALKIKAMAEGLTCEAPSSFCESLLSPYSGRFLWATSIAHGHGWTEKPCHIKSCSALAPCVLSGDQSTKEAVMSTVNKAMAFRKHQAVQSLKKHCCKQAHGLKAVLPH